MDDLSAVTRIKQGDLAGLESLVERYQVRLVQAAYLLTADRDLAEELAQGAFVKAAEHIEQFDEARPFAPWLYRILVNDALKAARLQQQTVLLDDDPDEAPAAQIARYLTSPDLSPELQIEQEELRQGILAAVRSLPPEQRAVITMQYYLDLSQADISERLDRPLSTIKWWLHEARKRLRSRLAGLR